ncbi:plasmid recombination protein [uncultured Ruminococcus sp.]|uniref:plasmid recombination protein n=1 Tax=uncultured Ruminococcus sp. TaxID=165186 RepID=UPI0025ED7CE8|nr:plasmid recombination protein [uncultured Ruminococcus sp.]
MSGCFGRGDLNHNNRFIITENVNADRIRDDIIICQRSLKTLYHELFDEALAEYNDKQKRRDRKIANYQEHIRHSRQEKEFCEAIFQVGNRDDTGVDSDMCQEAAAVLEEYARSFEERNPHLKLFNAVIHMDESTPHLHIDFVPVCDEKRKNGMRVRNSLTGALRQQGLTGEGISNTITMAWVEQEKEHIGQLMLEHGIEWVKLGTHEKHKSVSKYKADKLREEIEAAETELDGVRQELASASKKKVKISKIESIEAKESVFGKKVTLSKEDYDKLSDTAKKYVAMQKNTQKLKNERDAAVQERDDVKTELATVSSELSSYKKKEEGTHHFSIKKFIAESQRITREEQLSRSLQKAMAIIDAHGLRDEYNHTKVNTAQRKNVLE